MQRSNTQQTHTEGFITAATVRRCRAEELQQLLSLKFRGVGNFCEVFFLFVGFFTMQDIFK